MRSTIDKANTKLELLRTIVVLQTNQALTALQLGQMQTSAKTAKMSSLTLPSSNTQMA